MIINSLLNTIIDLDSESAKKLQLLEHKYLLLHITNLNLKLYFTYQDNKLVISKQQTYHDFALTSITGSITAFMKQQPGELAINGDPMLAQQVQQILKNLDLDLEARIADFTGEVIAHEIAKFFSKQKSLAKHISKSLTESSKDYLLEEAVLFATKTQVQDFMNAVDQTAADLARIEYRMKKCASSIS